MDFAQSRGELCYRGILEVLGGLESHTRVETIIREEW